jgi:hypothetical protein
MMSSTFLRIQDDVKISDIEGAISPLCDDNVFWLRSDLRVDIVRHAEHYLYLIQRILRRHGVE